MNLPEPRPPLRARLTESEAAYRHFLLAIIEWEKRPYNQPSADKTWVETLLEWDRRHYKSAVRVR